MKTSHPHLLQLQLLLFLLHLLFSPDLHLLLSLLSSSGALKPFVGFSKPLVIAEIAGIPLNWYRKEAGRSAAGLSDWPPPCCCCLEFDVDTLALQKGRIESNFHFGVMFPELV